MVEESAETCGARLVIVTCNLIRKERADLQVTTKTQ